VIYGSAVRANDDPPHIPATFARTAAVTAADRGAVARVRAAYARIAEADRPEVWIALRAEDEALEDAAAVDGRVAAGEEAAAGGRTLAVKDNIDVAGIPTTAGCPAFAYVPQASAPVVERLTAAGAVVLGKTNLDQFATGLVGTRSPYGAVRDMRRPDRVSGGSSSGSGVAVALGIADIALGTDTAGSGRVPAAFQGITSIKPTFGLVPVLGVVPACRTLDCVNVFTAGLAGAELAMAHMTGPAPGDPTVRRWPADAPLGAPPEPRVGVPAESQLADLSDDGRRAFADAVAQLEARGARVVEIDVAPLLETGRLLYGGAFVAERYAAVGTFISEHLDQADPVVGGIIMRARDLPAHQLVADIERRDQLRVVAEASLAGVDALLLPTAPFQPTIAEVEADPVAVNVRVGTYTTFCNLLDLCAVTVPAGEADGGRFGVSVLARAFADRVAADVARLVTGEPAGAPAGGPDGVELVVFGAHRSGQPLNGQLTGAGARLLGTVRTAPQYRMHRIDGEPLRPGVVRVREGGGALEAELWSVPPAGLAHLLAGLPAPLALGRVRLADGRERVGFLCEAAALDGAEDITRFGSWPAWQAGVPVAGA